MITMLMEIDESIIDHYDVLYSAAIYDLEKKKINTNELFNALGIINSFWAWFEPHSETKEIIQNYLKHKDEDIRDLAHKILEL